MGRTRTRVHDHTTDTPLNTPAHHTVERHSLRTTTTTLVARFSFGAFAPHNRTQRTVVHDAREYAPMRAASTQANDTTHNPLRRHVYRTINKAVSQCCCPRRGRIDVRSTSAQIANCSLRRVKPHVQLKLKENTQLFSVHIACDRSPTQLNAVVANSFFKIACKFPSTSATKRRDNRFVGLNRVDHVTHDFSLGYHERLTCSEYLCVCVRVSD